MLDGFKKNAKKKMLLSMTASSSYRNFTDAVSDAADAVVHHSVQKFLYITGT